MAAKPIKKKNKEIQGLESALYIVSTPIGNGLDWTLRAQNVLSQCDVVAAEDSRVLKTLLQKAGISAKKIVTYHEHNEKESAQGLLGLIKSGQSVALTTDAGTPLISDPGYRIVRETLKAGLRVIPVPGASSLTAALSVCGIGGGSVYYGGFLPSQPGARQALLTKSKALADTIVFFETPHRLRDTLEEVEKIYGAENEMTVCRELTKTYEEILLSTASGVKKYFQMTEPRGEFVLVLKGQADALLNKIETKQKIHELLDRGLSASDIIESLQPVSQMTRKELYDSILSLKKL